MKLSSLMIRKTESQQTLDERRKAIGRKDAGQAYRKSAEYFGEKRDTALRVLEELLSGKKEQDVNHDVAVRVKQAEEFQQGQQVKELEKADRTVRAHEQAHKAVGGHVTGPIVYDYEEGPDGQQYAVGGEVAIYATHSEDEKKMIETLELVRRAALAPAQPSPQDYRVAASAEAQIQQLRGIVAEERTDEESSDRLPDYVTASTDIDVPERFLVDRERDATQSAFDKDFTQSYTERKFAMASTNYQSHMIMVKNGYRDPLESTFSLIA